MGNIIHTLSGKNKKNSDDILVVKKLEQQLQLFKANPVFTMFLKFVENLEHQVQLFKAKLDFTIVSKYVKKVEQHAKLLNEKYVFPVFYKFLDSLPSTPQEEETDTKSVVLYQVGAIGGYFLLKWAWGRWIQPREDDSDSDVEPFD